MKTTTKLLLMSLLTMSYLSTFAQEKEAERVVKGMDMSGSSNSRYTAVKPPRSGEIVGSVFLNDQWTTASLSMNNGTKHEALTIRYNLYFDYFEVKKTNQEVIYVDGKYVDSFTQINALQQKEVFERVLKKESKLERSTFGHVLYSNPERLVLYNFTIIDLQKADYNPSLNTGSRDDRITQKTEFWIKYNGVYFKVGSSKKKFAGIFGSSHENEIIKKIKTSKWNLKKETDLIELIKFIDAIL